MFVLLIKTLTSQVHYIYMILESKNMLASLV